MISHHQSMDNSLLSYRKNFQPDWSKIGWVMAKKRMLIYGIIVILRFILAYNLAKYQNFSMRPGLFDNYHQITCSLQFSVQYHKKCGFYAQKTFRKIQKCHFLNSRFFESAHCVLSYNLGYDKYFFHNSFLQKEIPQIL